MPILKRITEKEKLQKWQQEHFKDWFAKGAFKRVYDKKKSRYPKTNFFYNRGRVVKVGYFLLPAKARYYELKIIHLLFPKSTIQPHGAINMTKTTYPELHCKKERLSKQHKEIMQRKKTGETITINNFKPRDKSTNKPMQKIMQKMLEKGIDPGVENDLNVNSTRSKNPKFLEPNFSDYVHLNEVLKQLLKGENEKTKRKILIYFERFLINSELNKTLYYRAAEELKKQKEQIEKK